MNIFKRWSKYLLTLLSCILTLFSVSPLRWSQWQIIDWYSDAIPILDQFLNGLTNHVTIWPFKNPKKGTPVFECMVFRYQFNAIHLASGTHCLEKEWEGKDLHKPTPSFPLNTLVIVPKKLRLIFVYLHRSVAKISRHQIKYQPQPSRFSSFKPLSEWK